MRRKYTFLLTVLQPEDTDEALHGRLQLIQNQEADTFNGISELKDLIENAIKAIKSDVCNYQESGLSAVHSCEFQEKQ